MADKPETTVQWGFNICKHDPVVFFKEMSGHFPATSTATETLCF